MTRSCFDREWPVEVVCLEHMCYRSQMYKCMHASAYRFHCRDRFKNRSSVSLAWPCQLGEELSRPSAVHGMVQIYTAYCLFFHPSDRMLWRCRVPAPCCNASAHLSFVLLSTDMGR